MEKKKYDIEYRDCTGMRCGVEMEAVGEKEAIIILQQELIEEGDYMVELISIDEVEDSCSCGDCEPEWKLEDGTILEQEHQNTLNDAMDSMVNQNGLTLREAMELKSKNK